MDILAKARKLESRLTRTVERAAERVWPAADREPLEVVHAVVDAVEREVQPAGRGRHLFPYNRVRVLVLAPSPAVRVRFEAVFASEPTLRQRVATRLEAAGCAAEEVDVDVVFVGERGTGWTSADHHVEFDRVAPTPEMATTARLTPVAPPELAVTIVAGQTDQPRYAFRLTRIDLGRCGEVRDHRNHLLRTNHVAFSDVAERPNQTVSRRHAHVTWDAEAEEFRVYDDGSEQGTGLMRSGKTIAIPPGARGVRLQSGDEILLGQARVRIEIARG